MSEQLHKANNAHTAWLPDGTVILQTESSLSQKTMDDRYEAALHAGRLREMHPHQGVGRFAPDLYMPSRPEGERYVRQEDVNVVSPALGSWAVGSVAERTPDLKLVA